MKVAEIHIEFDISTLHKIHAPANSREVSKLSFVPVSREAVRYIRP